MHNCSTPDAYSAPQCSTEEKFLEGILCESPDGVTEDFGDLVDFEW